MTFGLLSSVSRSPGDIDLWCRLFMLAKCVLASPAAGHKLKWREIPHHVKSHLQHWSDGDIIGLGSEALEDGEPLSRRLKQSVSSSTSRNTWRAKRAVQEGHYSRAIKSLTSNGLT